MSGQEGLAQIAIDARGSFSCLADPCDWIERVSAAIAVVGGCPVVDPVDMRQLDEAAGQALLGTR